MKPYYGSELDDRIIDVLTGYVDKGLTDEEIRRRLQQDLICNVPLRSLYRATREIRMMQSMATVRKAVEEGRKVRLAEQHKLIEEGRNASLTEWRKQQDEAKKAQEQAETKRIANVLWIAVSIATVLGLGVSLQPEGFDLLVGAAVWLITAPFAAFILYLIIDLHESQPTQSPMVARPGFTMTRDGHFRPTIVIAPRIRRTDTEDTDRSDY